MKNLTLEKNTKILSIIKSGLIVIGYFIGMSMSNISFDHFSLYTLLNCVVVVVALVLIEGFFWKYFKPLHILLMVIVEQLLIFFALFFLLFMLIYFKAFLVLYLVIGGWALLVLLAISLLVLKIRWIKRAKIQTNKQSTLNPTNPSVIKVNKMNFIYSIALLTLFVIVIVTSLLLYHQKDYNPYNSFTFTMILVPIIAVVIDMLYWKKLPLAINVILPSLVSMPLMALVFHLGQLTYGTHRFHLWEVFDEQTFEPYILMYLLFLMVIPVYILTGMKSKLKLDAIINESDHS